MTAFGIGDTPTLLAAAERLGLTLADTFTIDPDGLAALHAKLASETEPATILVVSPKSLAREEVILELLRLEGAGARVVDASGQDPISAAMGEPVAVGGGSERAQKIRASMARKAMRGLVLGRIPYGYQSGENGALQEAPAEAPVVRQIFQMAMGGKGIRAIVKELNAQGLRTRRGGAWSMITIRDMLRNRVYTGTYNRLGSRVAGNHPALITTREFRDLQERLDAKAKKSGYAPGSPFLLSGLAVCGSCGSRMIGMTRRQAWKRQDGTAMSNVYRYYQCEAATNQGRCSYNTRRAAELEAEVLEGLAPQELLASARAVLHARLTTLAKEAAGGRHTPDALRDATRPLHQAIADLHSLLRSHHKEAVNADEPAVQKPLHEILEAVEDPGLRALLRESLQNRIEKVVVADKGIQVARRAA